MKILLLSILAVGMIGLMVPSVAGQILTCEQACEQYPDHAWKAGCQCWSYQDYSSEEPVSEPVPEFSFPSSENFIMSTFVHPEGKFALQYPSTWTVEQVEDNFGLGYTFMFYGNDVVMKPDAGFGYGDLVDLPNMTVYVVDLGYVPDIETRTDEERYKTHLDGSIFYCDLVADGGGIDDYSCSDVMGGEHGFHELDSGQFVYRVIWTEYRDYPGTEFDGYVMLMDVDFMCCDNEIVTVEFDIPDVLNLTSEQMELVAQVTKHMQNSFSFSSTLSNPIETKSETVAMPVEKTYTPEPEPISISEESSEGGGCLIATATFGSEMAPQVQFLRELRDSTVMTTQSGTAFMTGFNQFYYSFSPQIADYERENPVFKEAVKVTLTPLLTSLTLLNYVEVDTEEEMLGYGIGIILLNIGMYFVAPAILVISLKKRFL